MWRRDKGWVMAVWTSVMHGKDGQFILIHKLLEATVFVYPLWTVLQWSTPAASAKQLYYLGIKEVHQRTRLSGEFVAWRLPEGLKKEAKGVGKPQCVALCLSVYRKISKSPASKCIVGLLSPGQSLTPLVLWQYFLKCINGTIIIKCRLIISEPT